MIEGLYGAGLAAIAGGETRKARQKAKRKWLTTIRDEPPAVNLLLANGAEVWVGGFYRAVNLAGPFLLSC